MFGGIAQLVERLLCKQDVSGSSPLTSTTKFLNQQIDNRVYISNEVERNQQLVMLFWINREIEEGKTL